MTTDPRTEAGKKLEKYWKSIRPEGERTPLRSEFRITAEIAPIVPHIVITEVLDDDVVFRLAGTGIAAHQGIDISGKRYSDFASADQVARAVARIEAFHRLPCGFVSVHTEEYGRGVTSDVEVTGFPLRGDGAAELMMVLVVTPIGRGLISKRDTPLFLRPASYIDFIDLGAGTPDDAAVIKSVGKDTTREGGT